MQVLTVEQYDLMVERAIELILDNEKIGICWSLVHSIESILVRDVSYNEMAELSGFKKYRPPFAQQYHPYWWSVIDKDIRVKTLNTMKDDYRTANRLT